jgi:GT2 family glycosyltransferase
MVADLAPTLSYCVVNTNGREYLLACLTAIERTHPTGVAAEVLVLDNASDDGSADAVTALGGALGGKDGDRGAVAGESDAGTPTEGSLPIRLIELPRRTGKAENDSTLMREAGGRYCLLLNEDSELRLGAVAALFGALDADPRAAAAGPQLLDSSGQPVPCAWRFPGVGTALAGALFLHRWLTVESKGTRTRQVDWAQSSALLVRREAAAEVGYMDPEFFVYYDECDFAKRLAEAGWHSLYVPAAEAFHHDQLSTDLTKGLPRIVEFHRNRDLYMRKHHGPAAALAVRVLTAWAYAVRAVAATVLPDQPARAYWVHAGQALFPIRGTSIRDRVEGEGGA